MAIWFGTLPLEDQTWSVALAFAEGVPVDVIQRCEFLLGLLPTEVPL